MIALDVDTINLWRRFESCIWMDMQQKMIICKIFTGTSKVCWWARSATKKDWISFTTICNNPDYFYTTTSSMGDSLTHMLSEWYLSVMSNQTSCYMCRIWLDSQVTRVHKKIEIISFPTSSLPLLLFPAPQMNDEGDKNVILLEWIVSFFLYRLKVLSLRVLSVY